MIPRGISFSSITKHWWIQIVGVGLVAFVIAAGVSTITPFAPQYHDEFSYLLAADTILHGRLANPTPDGWQAFQSFHILVTPTYASKYPLGLGLFVALGWATCGLPIAGCWLAAALCASSITWMLAGVTSRRWALAGGLLVAFHPAMQTTWSQTLMSGWLTAAGSALLAGGIFRLRRGSCRWAAVACGLGIGLLALTRPFEGLVATCISAGLLWALWSGRNLSFRLGIIYRSAPLASLPIAAALSMIAWHNYAVSGRLSGMPYRLHEEQYGVAPLFVFGHQLTPSIETLGQLPQIMHDFHYGWALESFLKRPGFWGWLVGIAQAAGTVWGFWVAFAMIPVLTVGYWRKFRLARWLALAVGLQMLFSAAVCWVFPHYLSPMLPWLVVLSVLGIRRIFRMFVRAQWLSMAQPRRLVGAILAVQLVLLAMAGLRMGRDPNRAWAQQRAALAAQFEARDGEHLILVRYSPEHNPHCEWVYNLADLEHAKVLWARHERDEWTEQLKSRYAPSRFIWQLNPDEENAQPKLLTQPF